MVLQRDQAGKIQYPVSRAFEETTRKLSPSFCAIYNEAHAVENWCLNEICGVGYRMGLEFLIKDDLIAKQPNEGEKIKSMFLGKCITKYVANQNVKAVAERAAWLGNDETHYERRWEGKDVKDLKTVIDLALYWIQAEIRTAEALNSMPTPSRDKKTDRALATPLRL